MLCLPLGTGAYWLGIIDKLEDGKWRYISNGNEITFENWSSGQPNGESIHNSQCSKTPEVNKIRLNSYLAQNENDCFLPLDLCLGPEVGILAQNKDLGREVSNLARSSNLFVKVSA